MTHKGWYAIEGKQTLLQIQLIYWMSLVYSDNYPGDVMLQVGALSNISTFNSHTVIRTFFARSRIKRFSVRKCVAERESFKINVIYSRTSPAVMQPTYDRRESEKISAWRRREWSRTMK